LFGSSFPSLAEACLFLLPQVQLPPEGRKNLFPEFDFKLNAKSKISRETVDHEKQFCRWEH